jgi:hypothetical protein
LEHHWHAATRTDRRDRALLGDQLIASAPKDGLRVIRGARMLGTAGCPPKSVSSGQRFWKQPGRNWAIEGNPCSDEPTQISGNRTPRCHRPSDALLGTGPAGDHISRPPVLVGTPTTAEVAVLYGGLARPILRHWPQINSGRGAGQSVAHVAPKRQYRYVPDNTRRESCRLLPRAGDALTVVSGRVYRFARS